VAGVCSKHQRNDPDCDLCQTTVQELLGITDEQYAYMRAEAEDAGLYTCDCGFEYYKTVDACPLCRAERKIIIP
jgi:hypothetical protein